MLSSQIMARSFFRNQSTRFSPTLTLPLEASQAGTMWPWWLLSGTMLISPPTGEPYFTRWAFQSWALGSHSTQPRETKDWVEGGTRVTAVRAGLSVGRDWCLHVRAGTQQIRTITHTQEYPDTTMRRPSGDREGLATQCLILE